MQVILAWMNRASRQLPRPWATATVPSIDVQASLINRAAFAKLRELISPSWQSSPPRRGDHVDCSDGHPSMELEVDSGIVWQNETHLPVRRRRGINASAADEGGA